ncbi:sigma factor-like helix-turn-helix DNA-binding protein [Escherichia coli]
MINDFDIECLTYKQIADKHNIPIGTVKSRIHRGRKIIKNMVDE